MIMGKISVFHHKGKRKAADKSYLEQRFLKEFKATCKSSGELELKKQTALFLKGQECKIDPLQDQSSTDYIVNKIAIM